jgi:hypothetical protein
VYSFQATAMEERYKPVEVLPMVMVRTPDGQPYEPGINAMKDVIQRRFRMADQSLNLEDVFEEMAAVEQLCLMSGGHVRNLMNLMKATLERTDTLPIQNRAVRRAMSKLRDTYRRVIDEPEYALLANVHLDKKIVSNDAHRSLLFRRCVLEYRCLNQEEEETVWHDIHPLIFGLEQFQDELKRMSSER